MNDPTEGGILGEYFNLKMEFKTGLKEEQNVEYTPFIACFTFNHDSLNQFRLYGKTEQREATGVSIVFEHDFFGLDLGYDFSINQDALNTEKQAEQQPKDSRVHKQPIYRCIYVDPKTGYLSLAKREKVTFYKEAYFDEPQPNKEKIDLNWINYQNKILEKENKVSTLLGRIKAKIEEVLVITPENQTKDLKNVLNLILLPIKFLVKHAAFENEQECRICYITSLSDKNIKMDFNKKWLYIEYSEKIKENIKYIYVATGAREHYPYIVRLLNGKVEKVRISDNPFRAR